MRILKEIKSEHGFTLIEMLVAAAVSSIILLMIYTAYSSIVRTVNYGQRSASYYEKINMAVRRIDSDISNTYWKKDRKNLIFKGDVNSGFSRLNFITCEYRDMRIVQGIRQANPAADIHEVSIFIRKNKKGSGYDLMRRRDLHYDDNPEEGGTEDLLLERVRSLKFEYQYRSDWKDSWNSEEVNKLPRAVRTTLTAETPYGKEDTYTFLSLLNIMHE